MLHEIPWSAPTPSQATGASASASGVAGLVPTPPAGSQAKLLRGDMTYVQQPTTYKGTVSGGSVPATSSSAGDWYYISAAGTSQSTTWAVGDMAIYNGSSGSWSQIPFSSLVPHLAPLRNNLAPAQALAFNGTTGCTVTLSAFGTANFTIAALINVRSLAANFIITDGDTGCLFYVMTTGALRIINRVTSTTVYTSDAGVITTGKTYAVAYARGSMYVNGVLLGTATDTATYSGPVETIGSANAGTGYANGTLRVWIYNRALSAAEVLALYETNTPDGSDYGTSGTPATNATSLVTGDDSTFASATGWWGIGGSATISGGVLSCPSSADYVSRGSLLTIGKRYRVTAGTITGQMQVSDTVNAAVPLVSGGSVEITAAGTTLAIGTASSGTLADVTVYPIGLVCAPEINAPGNGYQWKDASGNKADIILPTTGVTWALPDLRPNSVRGTLTWAGTHEAKSLLSQRALPTGAVITLITRDATTASSGSGCTIGTTGTATKWQALDTYTTAKEIATLAAQIPTDDTANQNDIVVDPDTANYTGSISVDVHYVITQGT